MSDNKDKAIGKGFLIYVSFFLVFGATAHTGILAKLGLAGNYGVAGLISLFLTLALVDRHWALPTIAWILNVLANSPKMAERLHYDIDIMAAALIGIVVLPFVLKMMDD
jgi:hypothetical protein